MGTFSRDWTTDKCETWERVLRHLRDQPLVQGLEIGCFEGQSTLWFVRNVLTGTDASIDCVDPWSDHSTMSRFDTNVEPFSDRVRKHRMSSFEWLTKLHARREATLYDFIYVDGDHRPDAVLNDLALCWPLLRPGGILICDDYLLDQHRPKTRVAIDGFFACRRDWTLVEQNWQFIARKSVGVEAVVVSVDYADYLECTLPALTRFTDKVVVVTSPDDQATHSVVKQNTFATLVTSDCFFADGAKLNKGAAINLGLDQLAKTGWVLLADADVLLTESIPLPQNKQALWGAERKPIVGYNAFQKAKHGGYREIPPVVTPSSRRPRFPLGYFQLWHWPTNPRRVSDSHWNASTYDHEFANLWPSHQRQWIQPYHVLHLETADNHRGINWSGRKTRPFRASGLEDRPQKLSRKNPDCGVITAANSDYWYTLRLLAEATSNASYSLAIVDHGLTETQIRWVKHLGATILEVPPPNDWNSEPAGQRLREPPSPPNAWLKPWLCQHSPFERSVWIDSDAVPLRNLDRMFSLLESNAWLTRESWVRPDAMRDLYQPLIEAMFGELPARFNNAHRINTGVFGFRRNDAWLKSWWRYCFKIVENPDWLRLCRLRDQAALVAMLCDPESSCELPRIMLERSLNWPANGAGAHERALRKRYDWRDKDLLQTLCLDHPEVSVVHWLGSPKPWKMSPPSVR